MFRNTLSLRERAGGILTFSRREKEYVEFVEGH